MNFRTIEIDNLLISLFSPLSQLLAYMYIAFVIVYTYLAFACLSIGNSGVNVFKQLTRRRTRMPSSDRLKHASCFGGKRMVSVSGNGRQLLLEASGSRNEKALLSTKLLSLSLYRPTGIALVKARTAVSLHFLMEHVRILDISSSLMKLTLTVVRASPS